MLLYIFVFLGGKDLVCLCDLVMDVNSEMGSLKHLAVKADLLLCSVSQSVRFRQETVLVRLWRESREMIGEGTY